jgi:hypothetical protein
MTHAELLSGVRWLCNRLYRPAAFENRVARFIDQYQAPEPRPNSRRTNAPPREVDNEWLELTRRIAQLGPAEAAMAARLQARLTRKPSALTLVLLAMAYYMQIRHMFQTNGLWDPALAAQPRPIFDRPEQIPLTVPVPLPVFSIL